MKKQAKKHIRIIRTTIDEYNENWPPKPANEYISWFQARLNEIPTEYRNTAEIEINSQRPNTFETDRAYIQITYYRPETDEEENIRLTNENHRKEQQRLTELRTLTELHTKYGIDTWPIPQKPDSSPLSTEK